MGRRRRRARERERESNQSQTLPPSPSHSFSSSSSSDFEFTISSTPLKTPTQLLCPADELFYKGQLLPLHLSPRLSMVRTLLLASPSTSSSDTTTASRNSTGSSSNDSNFASECDSARASSVTEEDEFKRVHQPKKPSKYFSLSRFSNVFKAKNKEPEKSLKKVSATKEVIRKYLKKVKPLYDKFSSQKQKVDNLNSKAAKIESSVSAPKSNNGVFSNSFSGNLKYPKRRRCVSSCPSSMRSSPTHPYSILPRTSVVTAKSIASATTSTTQSSDLSSMEELHSAIQGAIAHCKNSMVQTTTSSWASREI